MQVSREKNLYFKTYGSFSFFFSSFRYALQWLNDSGILPESKLTIVKLWEDLNQFMAVQDKKQTCLLIFIVKVYFFLIIFFFLAANYFPFKRTFIVDIRNFYWCLFIFIFLLFKLNMHCYYLFLLGCLSNRWKWNVVM